MSPTARTAPAAAFVPGAAPPAPADRGTIQIVTFRLGDDLFAADVRAVERVLRYREPRPVPDVPPWISGVIEYQKRVVPVIDLRLRFELAAAAPTGEARILVFNAAAGWVAGVVDAVLDVSAHAQAQVEAAPALFRGLAAEYLHGIVRRDGGLVLVVDAERLVQATDRVLVQRVAAAGAPRG